MKPFEYYNPTKIIFGENSINEVGKETLRSGDRVLLVSTRGAVEKTGLLQKVRNQLYMNGAQVFEFYGVEPNPKLKSVLQGVRIARECNVNVVLAVGGGSVIDCAKAIAYTVMDHGNPWDFFLKKRAPERALPLVVVLTISATGSEANNNSVITNEETKQKLATHFNISYPVVSIIDPKIQLTVPKRYTACSLVDILAHTLEAYFDGYNDAPFQDRIAEGIVETIIQNDDILDDLHNIDKRSAIALAATYALNGVINKGRQGKALPAHKIEHVLGGKYDMLHAEGLSPILPAVLETICLNRPKRFAQLNKRVFNKEYEDELQSGMDVIRYLRTLFEKWGMPTRLREVGVKADALQKIAEECANEINEDLFNKAAIMKILSENY